MKIAIQTDDFDVSSELALLRSGRPDVGAVVSFVGTVREMSAVGTVAQMTLEHYPGMTEAALADIVQRALSRWDIMDAVIIHRIGELSACDQIVLVAVAGRHRHAAFEACEFMMDFLKTQAPFWKKEAGTAGAHWVDARHEDEAALQRWSISE